MVASLEINGLEVSVGKDSLPVHALRGVDLSLMNAQVTGLVGETGSGKSMTALAALGLLPQTAKIGKGSVKLDGQDLIGLTEKQWQQIRGRRISIIFQNAQAALHPMLSVGAQMVRLHQLHVGGNRQESKQAAKAMLSSVGLPHSDAQMQAFPHQLSGGQCQRVMIAMALICQPQIVFADEPTSGLDVTIQKQVLETLMKRVREAGMTMLLISHDIGVIRHTCDHVAIMYAGQVVEYGPKDLVLEKPAHPYTQALLSCLDLNQRRMPYILGTVPDLRREISGCAFANRCAQVSEDCRVNPPAWEHVDTHQFARCVLYHKRL